MNFCSHCGVPGLEEAVPEGDRFTRLVCSGCGKVHYRNPRLIVGCLVVKEGRVLLCKRSIEPMAGYWNLPAGFLERKERVEEGAKRETWEEACAEVELKRLHCIYNLPHVDQVYMHFLAELKKEDFRAGEETLDARLFHPEEIPWEDIAFSSTRFALERYFEDPDRTLPHIGGKEYETSS